jgi:hypothetical protein
MGAKNCWEFFDCGREPGGSNTSESGICPAAANPAFYGVNGGRNGGRACWVASGKFQNDEIAEECAQCAFYKRVCQEQGPAMRSIAEILFRLKAS